MEFYRENSPTPLISFAFGNFWAFFLILCLSILMMNNLFHKIVELGNQKEIIEGDRKLAEEKTRVLESYRQDIHRSEVLLQHLHGQQNILMKDVKNRDKINSKGNQIYNRFDSVNTISQEIKHVQKEVQNKKEKLSFLLDGLEKINNDYKNVIIQNQKSYNWHKREVQSFRNHYLNELLLELPISSPKKHWYWKNQSLPQLRQSLQGLHLASRNLLRDKIYFNNKQNKLDHEKFLLQESLGKRVLQIKKDHRLEVKKIGEDYSIKVSNLKNNHQKEIGIQESRFTELQREFQSYKNQTLQKERFYRQELEILKMALQKGNIPIPKIEIPKTKHRPILKIPRKLRRAIFKDFHKVLAKINLEKHLNFRGELQFFYLQDLNSSHKTDIAPSIKKALEKIIPLYTQLLFEKYSPYIESIELIGTASPTFQGFYVNPKDRSKKAQEAIKYNQFVSKKRALSVYEHLMTKMKFLYQKELKGLLVLKGEGHVNGSVANDFSGPLTTRDYCRLYDCKSQQKIIIRYKLKKGLEDGTQH